MARCVEEREGVWRICRKGGLLGPRVRVLPGAVAKTPTPSAGVFAQEGAVADASGRQDAARVPAGGDAAPEARAASATDDDAAYPQYGWVRSLLPAPRKDDSYLVEFLSADTFRIWGYADRYGRAFVCDRPLAAPPARDADIVLVKVAGDECPSRAGGTAVGADHLFAASQRDGAALGFVQLRDAHGVREVARICRERGRYSLFDSWCDFGPAGVGISYDDALARCFFAFSFRPLLGGANVPARGLSSILGRLESDAPFVALIEIVHGIQQAVLDPAMRPPALAMLLATWLDDVGAERVLAAARLGAHGAPVLRLVRTARYSNTFYIGKTDPDDPFPDRDIWAMESALNRFLLIHEELGEGAALASLDECGRIDAELFSDIAVQSPCAEHPQDEGRPVCARFGEWDVRRAIGEAMERFKLPVRFSAQFRADVSAGEVAFELDSPPADLMPARAFDAARGSWADVADDERERAALLYAERLGVMLAAAAFHGGAAVERVTVVAYAARFDEPSQDAAPLYRVTFTRAAFCEGGAYRAAADDPEQLFSQAGASFGEKARADWSIDDAVSAPVRAARASLPETAARELSERERRAFGAEAMRDVRIRADAQLRSVAERVAQDVARTTSATEAVRCVQATRASADDPRVFDACARLMTALIEDAVDPSDENALVACFMGDDPYLIALGQARAVARTDAHKAVEILRDAIARAEASHRFDDNAEAVHRMFDSYASRIIYNRERAHTALWRAGVAGAHPDEGKRVELLPASLAMCYLDAVRLLEESFDYADEALELGLRCIQVAPTYSPAYRQTARAYMLVGDMPQARKMLARCLEIATLPDEIAAAYYQLAYVEWKSGRSDAGVACYVKSMMTSPIYLAQCTVEMHQLMAETACRPVEGDRVDGVLADAGIPVAPSDVMLDALDDAMRAAIDADMFGMGSSLLALRLHYRPDDALADVLQSLNAPLVPNTLD